MWLKKRACAVGLMIAFIGVGELMIPTLGEKSMSKEAEAKEDVKRYNRLISEKSPYLLQHADNPVDWYPWGPEAFERARKENKPIFLSIGYSTCHWCHVMEHESFEDPEVARLMNEVFVSIKVDREERPDIDGVYMSVSRMLTGTGGWPLTIIMTPDKKPFFATTYIPKNSRFGRIGMLELVPRIREIWSTRREDVLNSADQITAALQRVSNYSSDEDLGISTLKLAYEHLSEIFDEQHAGFASFPKFPTPHNLLFLLRYWRRTNDAKALEMVEKTLQSMRRGGIYDHIGFGFHRYSTDSQWLVPHFEKMLYDQAMLAMAYTEAYQATRKREYKKTAQEIFTYILRDMTAPEGGFYSAEDADSEGVEGKFYLWTLEEVRGILGREDADLMIRLFNIKEEGNFVEGVSGEKTFTNILHLKNSLKEFASDFKTSDEDLQKRLEAARQKLFAYREKRIHPFKDTKILTDWNGLMIAALAKGGRVFEEQEYVKAAKRAADFILKDMRTSEGRLFHRYRNGEAAIPSFESDYAFLIWGLLELYEASFDEGYLQISLDLNLETIKHFWDDDGGGFFSMADDGESLLVRQKNIYDGAIPSGNSVAMLNFLRLGRITANHDFEEKAARIGRAFSKKVKQAPAAYTQLMVGVDFGVGSSYEVVIVGNSHAKDTKELLNALRESFIPNKVVILRPTEEESPRIVQLAKFIKYYTAIDNRATAYVCLNYKCNFPTTDKNKMLDLLKSK